MHSHSTILGFSEQLCLLFSSLYDFTLRSSLLSAFCFPIQMEVLIWLLCSPLWFPVQVVTLSSGSSLLPSDFPYRCNTQNTILHMVMHMVLYQRELVFSLLTYHKIFTYLTEVTKELLKLLKDCFCNFVMLTLTGKKRILFNRHKNCWALSVLNWNHRINIQA